MNQAIKKQTQAIEADCTQILFQFLGPKPDAETITALCDKITHQAALIKKEVRQSISTGAHNSSLRWCMNLIMATDNKRETDALKYVEQNLSRATEQYSMESVAKLVSMGIDVAIIKEYTDTRSNKKVVDLKVVIDEANRSVQIRRMSNEKRIAEITLQTVFLSQTA